MTSEAFCSAALAAFVAVFSGPVLAADNPSADAPIYVLRYAGIVCVKAPCPVWEAVEVGNCTRVNADSIDTVGVMDPDYQANWLQSWLMQNSVTVRGVAAPDPRSEAILFKVLKILGGPDPRVAGCPPDVWRE
jgi:hypothetical protein